jgi:two-component system NarL family sensor kinase
LEIADDGVGFDLEAVQGRGGLGLPAMQERAAALGGKLAIRSSPSAGTQVIVEV